MRARPVPAANAPEAPNRTLRESYLWEQISGRQAAFFRQELGWVRDLRTELRKVI